MSGDAGFDVSAREPLSGGPGGELDGGVLPVSGDGFVGGREERSFAVVTAPVGSCLGAAGLPAEGVPAREGCAWSEAGAPPRCETAALARPWPLLLVSLMGRAEALATLGAGD